MLHAYATGRIQSKYWRQIYLSSGTIAWNLALQINAYLHVNRWGSCEVIHPQIHVVNSVRINRRCAILFRIVVFSYFISRCELAEVRLRSSIILLQVACDGTSFALAITDGTQVEISRRRWCPEICPLIPGTSVVVELGAGISVSLVAHPQGRKIVGWRAADIFRR
jgi:hypothetical protein